MELALHNAEKKNKESKEVNVENSKKYGTQCISFVLAKMVVLRHESSVNTHNVFTPPPIKKNKTKQKTNKKCHMSGI